MEHHESEPARADERAAITFQREVFPEAAATEPLRGSARHDESVPRQTRRSCAKPDMTGPPHGAPAHRLLPWCFREHLQHAPAEKRFC